jgi:nucleotidyltransferase/DNA polymerase involved in DNA repair
VWDALVPLGTAVEPTAWHGGYVDVTGCLPRRGVRAHLAALARRLEDLTRQPPAQGVAGNKLIARHASLWGRVVAPEEALGFLHGQRLRPERWLTREMIATLDELGCHVWGEVAQVPEPRLRALFGVRGTILNRWSEGVDPRPVQPRYPPPTETARVQLEPEQRTGWLAALEELSATLAERLRRRGETASEVVLALGLRQGAGVRRGSWQALRRRLARGVNQPEALRTIVLGLLPMDLEPQDLEEARLTLRGLRRHGAVQGVLFVEAHEERRHLLDSALARVRARWGLLGLGYAPEVVASRRRLAEAVWLLEEVG